MADVDLASALPLEPGERVLWEGRPGFGAPWHEVKSVLRTGFFVWAALAGLWGGFVLLMAVARAVGDDRPLDHLFMGGVGALAAALWWAVVVAPFVAAFVLARIVGPYHVSLVLLALFGPAFAFVWAARTATHGWNGAVARLGEGEVAWWLLVLGLPLVRIGLGVARRMNLLYVVTDRRAAAVRTEAAGPRVLWIAPLVEGKRLQARVVWPWRSRRRGSLAVGFGDQRRDVAMIRHPDEVLAIVRRALGDEVEGVVPRRRRRQREAPSAEVVDGLPSPPSPTQDALPP